MKCKEKYRDFIFQELALSNPLTSTELFEMVNIWSEDSGLDKNVVIWIGVVKSILNYDITPIRTYHSRSDVRWLAKAYCPTSLE